MRPPEQYQNFDGQRDQQDPRHQMPGSQKGDDRRQTDCKEGLKMPFFPFSSIIYLRSRISSSRPFFTSTSAVSPGSGSLLTPY